jgi:transcriptional regulator with XRE-family HTH domain
MTETPSPQGGTDDLTLAQKLDRLFATIHPRDRGEFTYREVEAGVRELVTKTGETEGSISASYVCQLRKGRRANPTIKQLHHLAAFFNVPMTYFVGTPAQVEAIDAQMTLMQVEAIDAQMTLMQAMRNHGTRDLALRISALTPEGLQAVVDYVTTLEKMPGMALKTRQPRSTRANARNTNPTP